VYIKNQTFSLLNRMTSILVKIRLCNIKVLFTNTSFGQKFINYLGPVIFNALPINVKKIFLMIKLT